MDQPRHDFLTGAGFALEQNRRFSRRNLCCAFHRVGPTSRVSDNEAVRIVLDTGQASISMIQRRLRIGYNRSARMVEQMEREGIVTPPDGARPRELRVRPGLSEE